MDTSNETTPFNEVIFKASDTATAEPTATDTTAVEPTTEPNADVTTTTQTDEPKETDAQKGSEDKSATKAKDEPKADPSKEPDKKDSKKPDDAKKGLNITFNGKKEEPKKTDDKPTDTTRETSTVDENSVLKFLQEKGLKVSSLSDLSVSETLPEAVEQFKKFNAETGRGIKDFYLLQKDWNKEDKDVVIKEYLRFKHPNLQEDDLADQIDLLRVTEDDEENLDERSLKQRRLQYNTTYSEALSFLNEKSKEYNTPLGNKPASKAQLSKEDIAKAHRPYWDARDNSLTQFNEISLSIDGVGDVKIPISDEDKAYITKRTNTFEDLVQEWVGEGGKSIDTDNLVEAAYWMNPQNRQKALTSMAEQLQVLFLDSFSKQNRNVTLDDPSITKNVKEGAAKLVVDGNKNPNDSSFGKPIFPLGKK